MQRVSNVLFLCTGNSARSILAEAILQDWPRRSFSAFSAGSQPKGEVHPYAIDMLVERGHRRRDWQSKSWDEFALPESPAMDFIITVCDNAAGETCPVWPGRPITAHWGIPDPATATRSESIKRRAFSNAYDQLVERICAFTALSIEAGGFGRLSTQVRDIGTTEKPLEL